MPRNFSGVTEDNLSGMTEDKHEHTSVRMTASVV
jgi:hypothetical protein